MFVKKVFQRNKIFLANLDSKINKIILLFSKINVFFALGIKQRNVSYADFKLLKKLNKLYTPQKEFCQNFFKL